MSDKPYFRDSSIAVSNATKWKLAKIVKGQAVATILDVPATVDAFADDILKQWITAHYPELHEIWNEREALDDKALERVKQKMSF